MEKFILNERQKYKVFSNQNELTFSTENFERNSKEVLLVKRLDDSFFDQFLSPKLQSKKFMFLAHNPTESLIQFASFFKIVKAAGGLVRNNNNELLAIKRNGIWDLPKGKIEEGEIVEEAALREVQEECGVTNLKVLSFFDTTYHVYPVKNGKYALKPTYWFLMETDFRDSLIPQKEEGISEVKFLNALEEKKFVEDTFPSLKFLLTQ